MKMPSQNLKGNLIFLISNYNLQERLFFYNAVDDIREIYSISEIVFNLSVKPEPFGRTLLEAAMMGKKYAAGIEVELVRC